METKKEAPQLGVGDFSEAEYRSNRWVADIAAEIERSRLQDPNFWAHHSHKLRPWDRIEARAKDGTWMAEYLVLDCSRTWAKVKELIVYQLSTSDVSQSQAQDKYLVKHRGAAGWSVIRTGDKAVIAEGHKTRDGAEQDLQNLLAQEKGASVTA